MRRLLPAGLLLCALAVDGRTLLHQRPDRGAVIIELAAPPLLARSGDKTAASAELNALLDRLERDIATIEGPRTAATTTQPVLRHRFTRTFAGASVRVDPKVIDSILELDYVRAVHPDRVQNALLHDSVAQVGATTVWETYGARGDGVLVAVIDSGIDYMHPALGGGIGPGFKVRGGRDFVNNDNDPMDDHGHGTHVAGIVAANGDGLLGVAPDASLLALKALDEAGSGVDSWVMAAVEEAAARNADVVNMSLGRPAAPDDPVVRAIETASAAGVLFVVAAGNGGVFLDIGSPANAPSAITVGAIDKNGRLAPFSSKGPVVPDGSIKPEVVAPGVAIVSTWFGGGTRAANGTSMATPHVAGVAALLRDVHPDWTAARLRAAIINSARPMEGDIMAVGAGSVHAADAVKKNVQPSANTLSFGVSDQTQHPWVVSRTIAVTNRSDVAQSMALSVDGLREGVELIPSATSISLEAGASTNITLELRVDHAKVPPPESGSLSFGGRITLSGDSLVSAIPWSFVKASRARVTWNGARPAVVRVATEHMIIRGATTEDVPSVDLFVGTGAASVWAESSSGTAVYHVLRDGIDFAATPTVTVGPPDAPHEIRFLGADASGRLLSDRAANSNRNILLSHPFFEKDLLDSYIYVSGDQELFISSLPPSARLLAFESAFDRDPAVTWTAQYAPLAGIDRDTDLTIAPERWQALSATAVPPPGLGSVYQSLFAASWVFSDGSTVMSINRPQDDGAPAAADSSIQAWITSPVSEDAGTGVLIDIGEGEPDRHGPPLMNPELVARFSAVEGGIVSGHDRSPRISSRVIGSREAIVIGEGPAHPQATIGALPSLMFAQIQWAGPHGEERVHDAKRMEARLYDVAGTLIATGEAPVSIPGFPIGRVPGFQMNTELPGEGTYILEASTSSFRVGGLPASGTLRLTFDTNGSDSAPPTLTSLRIDDGSGRTSASVLHRGEATVTFSAVDFGMAGYRDVNRERTLVEYRANGAGDDRWSAVTAETIAEDFGSAGGFGSRPDGVVYQVRVKDMVATPVGAVDLRITLEDGEGNQMSYTVEPAFVITPGRRRAVAAQ